MKTEVLLRSIGKINDELIADAESEANTKRKPGWAKLGIMAACLALVLCTGIAYIRRPRRRRPCALEQSRHSAFPAQHR